MAINSPKNGFLLINKPSGPTSHDIIDELRKITGIRKIGHAGTLDPFASGLLLVGIGEATKLLKHYVGLNKTYEAVLRLGAESDTYDRTGRISKSQFSLASKIPETKIQKILQSFIGKQKQIPPMYSAKKVDGKKLYELARKGKNIKREPAEIEVYDIKLKSYALNLATCTFSVSSGTYIRTLAHDIGKKLGHGAYLEELKRTTIGGFKLKDAITIIARERTRDRGNPSNHAPESSVKSFDSAQDDVSRHLMPLKTVLVSGTFDGVHKGHKNYFQQARAFGHRLICVVGRASIVEKIKGKRPCLLARERIKLIKQCPEIDQVYLGAAGADNEIYDFIASLKPDVIALGYDQKAYTKNLKEEMKKRGLNVVIKKTKPFLPNKYKNSILSQNIDKKQ